MDSSVHFWTVDDFGTRMMPISKNLKRYGSAEALTFFA